MIREYQVPNDVSCVTSRAASSRCAIGEGCRASPPAALGWPPRIEVSPRGPIPSRDDAPTFEHVHVAGEPNTATPTEETSAAGARLLIMVTRGEDLRHGARSARAIVRG